jgi:hypothetical protein
MEHFESDYVQNFLDILAENDIGWQLTPLYRPDVAELVSAMLQICSLAVGTVVELFYSTALALIESSPHC